MWSKSGVLTLINCEGDAIGQSQAFSTNKTEANAFGCAGGGFGGANTTSIYNAIGCDAQGIHTRLQSKAGTTNRSASVGQCFAFNKISVNTTGKCIFLEHEIGARGVSISGNVLECYGGSVDPALFVNADSNDNPAQNVVAHQITCVGGRTNWLYAPSTTSTTAIKRGFIRNAIMMELNTKADIFESDATSLGNESCFYRVGCRNVMLIKHGADGNVHFGPGHWIGEVQPLNFTREISSPQDPGFADDASNDGDDSGDGDYTPTIADMASDRVPAADVAFLCDLDGTNWTNDGTDAKGALQAG